MNEEKTSYTIAVLDLMEEVEYLESVVRRKNRTIRHMEYDECICIGIIESLKEDLYFKRHPWRLFKRFLMGMFGKS